MVRVAGKLVKPDQNGQDGLPTANTSDRAAHQKRDMAPNPASLSCAQLPLTPHKPKLEPSYRM